MIFSNEDLKQLAELGIPKEKVLSQIQTFQNGFPCVNLVRPATCGDGITVIEPDQIQPLLTLFDTAAQAGHVMKFVPASGAASRMFHSLSYVLSHYDQHREELEAQQTTNEDVRACLDFLLKIERFPFYGDLPLISELMQNKAYDKVLELIVAESGLNYANMPKALVKFHRYAKHSRTALEEHLVETLEYAADAQGIARIHFTVSPEHRLLFDLLISNIRSLYESREKRLEISFSEQKRSTDTIALTGKNEPLRDKRGRLVFRPAGHGALIENLNELDGSLVFIKNIDNVVPDRLKETTYLYKRLLAGYLLLLQKRSHHYLTKISQNGLSRDEWHEAFQFARTHLNMTFRSGTEALPEKERTALLFDALDRPIRVCGMVKNQGEPGGGPFWVREKDGTDSLQIVEKNQIDLNSEHQKDILHSSTHFNPVDLVCGLRDYKGELFDLHRFSDPNTGFISTKSKDGKSIRVMELPGLWNGAMARWLTVFVEVPLITFNPVKTVNDLLRPEHQ